MTKFERSRDATAAANYDAKWDSTNPNLHSHPKIDRIGHARQLFSRFFFFSPLLVCCLGCCSIAWSQLTWVMPFPCSRFNLGIGYVKMHFLNAIKQKKKRAASFRRGLCAWTFDNNSCMSRASRLGHASWIVVHFIFPLSRRRASRYVRL